MVHSLAGLCYLTGAQLFAAMERQYGIKHDLTAELRKLKDISQKVRPFVIDTVGYLHQARISVRSGSDRSCFVANTGQGKSLLVEGANACLLDLDFGSYPYVTSSSTTIGGACTGLGIPPQVIGKVRPF